MTPAHAAHPAKAVPPKERITVIVATDCGSTTTKAILIERVTSASRTRSPSCRNCPAGA
ncbi:MAG: hypothetical protein ACKOHI_09285 [Phycisphaerales bacterium]